MKYVMRLAMLALVAVVLIPGPANSAKKKKDGRKKALFIACGSEGPATYSYCADRFLKEWYAARREEYYLNERLESLPDTRMSLEAEERLRKRSREAGERWRLEVEEAKREAASPPAQYPSLEWFSGIWCSDRMASPRQIRWQVVGPSELRRASFSGVWSDAHFSESSYTAEWKGDHFILPFDKGYKALDIRGSNDHYSLTEYGVSDILGRTFRGEGRYKRCEGRFPPSESKTSADEPARLDQTSRGLPVAPKVSVQTPTPALDCGAPAECTNLGLMHRNGFGVSQDSALALSLFRKGCDGGDETGCTHLGFMYEKGWHGVSQDLARARKIYRQECDRGHESCCDRLKKLN